MFEALSTLWLETERLTIRPVAAGDLKAIYHIHKIDIVNKYLPYSTWKTWDDAKHWFAKVQHRRIEKESEQYVIERREDQKIIGSCIVFKVNEAASNLEFGYVLDSAYWNKGYMLEATTSLLAALRPLVNSVSASIEVENVASLKLIEKLGFEKTGRKVEEGITLLLFAKNI